MRSRHNPYSFQEAFGDAALQDGSVDTFPAVAPNSLIDVLFQGNNAIFALVAQSGDVLQCSTGFAELVESDAQDIMGRPFAGFDAVFGKNTWATIVAETQPDLPFQSDMWVCFPDGRACHMQLNASMSFSGPDEADVSYLIYASDLSKFEKSHHEIARTANFDALTGIPNRRFLEARVEELVSYLEGTGGTFALFVIDVNDFKTVNDTYGHTVGDAALRYIAEAISDAVPLGETVARFGGDEFIVVIDDMADAQSLAKIMQELHHAVSLPFSWEGQTLRLQVSIGYSVYPEHGHCLEDLIHMADLNMLQEKRTKKSRNKPAGFHEASVGFDPCRNTELKQAVLNGQLVPSYQSIVSLDTGDVAGAEALCRWHKGEDGMLLPSEFISHAETVGLISVVDKAVIRSVCKDLVAARELLSRDVYFSFNVSAHTVGAPHFTRYMEATLREFDLEPSLFQVELTESTALVGSEHGRDCLHELNTLGFSLALDDFGTGFSSLSLLMEIPINRLKLDRSFVMDITSSERNQKIVRNVIGLCSDLEIDCIAEGIENASQAEVLQQMGARYGQGYHFGQPQGWIKWFQNARSTS